MFAVISTSLNPDSRSRIMAAVAAESIRNQSHDCQWVDLQSTLLPNCDAQECYNDPQVHRVAQLITDSHGILIASPIYNYDVAASAKNLIELTGKAWTDKVVGFLCAAGGQGSYMSVMSVANSLMLDFHSLILPRFVYATSESFHGDTLVDGDVRRRIEEMSHELVRVALALAE